MIFINKERMNDQVFRLGECILSTSEHINSRTKVFANQAVKMKLLQSKLEFSVDSIFTS